MQILIKISDDLLMSRDIFFAHFGRFTRSVLRYGHPASGDPGLRYGLRSLCSYIRYENSLQNHQKSGISLTFFEIPTLKK